MNDNPFRQLPSVTEILDVAAVQALVAEHSHDQIVATIRLELAELRQRLSEGRPPDGQSGPETVAVRVAQRLSRELRPKLRPVINATGIVLHTNLGRAPTAEEAAKAAYEAARGYLNLELDLETGKRSSRQIAIREWVCRLTGAESATAVNNNAAATVIALRALCQGKEVVLSRGQLIEIGGSFRIPEIMAVSGATLREVGTTNITRLADYERAIGPNTAALMQVHTSNYRVSGFTKSVPLSDLVALGKKHNLKVIDDIGSGALIDFARFGFQGEPVARDSIAAGADLVLFSGDKLLGGPQAGILAGRQELIQKIEKDPLMRAFRLDKMTLAALEATLRLYLNEERALREVPGLRMLGTPLSELRQRAEHLAAQLRTVVSLAEVKVSEDVAFVGGGSLPDQQLRTWVVEVTPTGLSDTDLAHRLRMGTPAVVGRLRDGKLVLDMRTVLPGQEETLVEAVRQLANEQATIPIPFGEGQAMLSIAGRPGRLCDGPSRRELLGVGAVSLLGLSLPDFFRSQAQGRPTRSGGNGFGRAQALIFLYLQGSPSHIDLWDPKPDAPQDIRGEFRPIATAAPGLFLGEVLPLLAQQARRFALVRSIGVEPRGLANHGAAIYMLMTGHDPSNFSRTGLAVPPSREDLPSVGAVVARYRPAVHGAVSYAALGGPVKEGAVTGVGQGAGVLGGAHDPFPIYEDLTQPLRLESLTLPPDATLGRLQGRFQLRSALTARGPNGSPGFDAYYEQAYALIESARAARAFRLDLEPATLRQRYGMTRFGQSCLMARRLIEAGTRFVQVNWPAGSDTEPQPGPDGSWDTHRNNFPILRDWRCPVFDQAASSLIGDLAARGLLESTLVVAIGEFGRSPRIGAPTTNNVGPGGRDHWPACYTSLLAGGGIRGGQVYGASDRYGAYPQANPVHPYDLIATIHHALGIDPTIHYQDNQNRPRRLVEHGGPVLGLF